MSYGKVKTTFVSLMFLFLSLSKWKYEVQIIIFVKEQCFCWNITTNIQWNIEEKRQKEYKYLFEGKTCYGKVKTTIVSLMFLFFTLSKWKYEVQIIIFVKEQCLWSKINTNIQWNIEEERIRGYRYLFEAKTRYCNAKSKVVSLMFLFYTLSKWKYLV